MSETAEAKLDPARLSESSKSLVNTMRFYIVGACTLMVIASIVSLWRLHKTQDDFKLILNDNRKASELLKSIEGDVKSLDRLLYALKFPNESGISPSEIENKILLERIVDEHDRFAAFADQDREKALNARWFINFVTYTSKSKAYLATKTSDKQTVIVWNQELRPLKQSILDDLDSLDNFQNVEASQRETALISSLDFSKGIAAVLMLVGCGLISLFGNKTIQAIEKAVKRRERAVQLEQEALTSIKNSAAKTEFMASMSHEIRTPLGAIIGISDILLRESNDPRLGHIVQTLASSSDHLHQVVNNFLDFAKLDGHHSVLKPVPSTLSRLIYDRIALLKVVAQKSGTQLSVEASAIGEDQFLIDETKFSQVLLNLTGNAIKFAKGGTVRVCVLTNELSTDVSQLTLEISDSGIGMTDKQIATLFQPYKQASDETERKFGGTGLGLAISQQIVKLMNGEIKVSSVLGEGSVFTVRLPLKRVGLKEVSSPTEELLRSLVTVPHAGFLDGMNVLVAEDNSTNQLVISAILKHLNIPFTIVTDGDAAVTAVEHGNFDLVLMDCHMPKSDGFEATRKIRILEDQNQSRRRIPIIALTASSHPADRGRCLSAGMDNFTSKPIKSDVLRNVILEVMQTAS